ncbi:MAG: cytidine deaminase [Candidatus Woesearchaeota archaeon]|jgi:cytidine deaminase
MISNQQLIKKAHSVVHPKKSVAGKLIADVGAALITDKGHIFLGVCIDTTEGNGVCAETSAITAMVTAGEYKIKKIVAVWKNGTVIAPCGKCREWMWQIHKDNWNTQIILPNNKIVTLKELLPYHWHNPKKE